MWKQEKSKGQPIRPRSARLTTVGSPPTPRHSQKGLSSVVWEPEEETPAAGTSPASGTRRNRKTGVQRKASADHLLGRTTGPLSVRPTTSTERERGQRLEILSHGRHDGFPSTISVYRKRQIRTAVPGGVGWGARRRKERPLALLSEGNRKPAFQADKPDCWRTVEAEVTVPRLLRTNSCPQSPLLQHYPLQHKQYYPLQHNSTTPLQHNSTTPSTQQHYPLQHNSTTPFNTTALPPSTQPDT